MTFISLDAAPAPAVQDIFDYEAVYGSKSAASGVVFDSFGEHVLFFIESSFDTTSFFVEPVHTSVGGRRSEMSDIAYFFPIAELSHYSFQSPVIYATRFDSSTVPD